GRPAGAADGPELEPPCARWRHAGCSVPLGDGDQRRRGLVLYGGRTPDQLCLADAYLALVLAARRSSSTERSAAWLGRRCRPARAALLARRLRPPQPAAGLPQLLASVLKRPPMMETPASAAPPCGPYVGPVQLDVLARQWTRLTLSGRLARPSGDDASAAPARLAHLLWRRPWPPPRTPPAPPAASLTEPATLCLIRVDLDGTAAQFVNLAADFSLDPRRSASAAPSKAFLAFNSATALLTPAGTPGWPGGPAGSAGHPGRRRQLLQLHLNPCGRVPAPG
uniref:SUEL-type lectin domain-containing protein n=1 Tax=Macrostomum lignano TaxID=282301 RepID=A0A1I8FQ22_9PLAT